jgi:hypothetical protein
MRNILLTESQLIHIMCEGVHVTRSKQTYGDLILDLIPIEQQLNSVNLSLFLNAQSVNELQEVAEYIDTLTSKKKQQAINEFLTTDYFKDNEAVAFAESRIRKIPIRGVNKYSNALSDLVKPDMVSREKERASRHDANLSMGEKIIRNTLATKDINFNKKFPMQMPDAYNYFDKWEGGELPIDATQYGNIEELNTALQPYFEKSKGYQKYMTIVNLCKKYSKEGTSASAVRYVYDGDSVYFPAKTKIELSTTRANTVGKFTVIPNGLKEVRSGIRTLGFDCGALNISGEDKSNMTIYFKVS